MVKKSIRPSTYDANMRLPVDLTPLIQEGILSLPESPKQAYLSEQSFSKFVSADTAPSQVRRQRAINKWLATERNNEATNDRLVTVNPDFLILPGVPYCRFIETVSAYVVDVIGEIPPCVGPFGSFSGGATTSRKRTESHPAGKYVGKADVTETAWPLIEDYLTESEIWFESFDPERVRIVPGNILFTVPKTTEIDRCCCKEPDLNMYLQKGAGEVIRSCLRRKGVDLNDQSKNRELARLGSLRGSLATLDLSSASDSISRELVFQLLPIHWYVLLDSLRSHVTNIGSEVHVNQMFSSMGNGFTFELESLLFYCISRAVCYHLGERGSVSVYGDDIIVPVGAAPSLAYALSFLGFETNVKKSYWSGDFRESCGGHYLKGIDITPFYIRRPVTTIVDAIHAANSLRKWANVGNGIRILDPEVETLWQLIAGYVPRMFWGGHDTSYTGRLVSDWCPSKPRTLAPVTRNRSNGIGGYVMWLDNTERRCSQGSLQTSSRAETLTKYRVKPVRGEHRRTDQAFIHELDDS